MESKMIDTYEDEEGHGPKRTMAFRLQALEDQVELLREAVDQASEDVRRIKGVIG